MAESTDAPPQGDLPSPGATVGDDGDTPGYKAPKQVDLKTLQDLDADDESLVKYKQQLLGATANVKDEGGPNIILQKLILSVADRPDLELDLQGDLSKFKKNPLAIKEGCTYIIRIQFRVQREIVSGLRYVQLTYRKGIKVDTSKHMVGSYGPKTEPHVFSTKPDEAPSGMMGRGSYTVKSKFTDDDKNVYLEWEWGLEIKKDWPAS